MISKWQTNSTIPDLLDVMSPRHINHVRTAKTVGLDGRGVGHEPREGRRDGLRHHHHTQPRLHQPLVPKSLACKREQEALPRIRMQQGDRSIPKWVGGRNEIVSGWRLWQRK